MTVLVRRALYASATLLLAGCAREDARIVPPLPNPPALLTGAAPARIDGDVGSTAARPPASVSYGREPSVRGPTPRAAAGGSGSGGTGDVSLDFADTDIREIASEVLGGILRVNFTIDPAVRGTATLRTVTPLTRDQVIPALTAMLAQNGAALVVSDGLYRVLPAAVAAAGPGLAGAPGATGGVVVPLRYASAEDLARVLQPFAGNTGRIVPDTGRNVLLVGGDAAVRDSLLELIRAFDVDVLAGQSYALLPAGSGDAKEFAAAMEAALRAGQGGAQAGRVRVVPMDRVNAVLVIASTRQAVDEARRVYALVDRTRSTTIRSWHVYYLQNGSANDVAFVLQQAFTPNAVTAQPSASAAGQTATANTAGGLRTSSGATVGGAGGGTGLGGGGLGGGGLSGGGLGAGGLNGGGLGGGVLGGGVLGGGALNAGGTTPGGVLAGPPGAPAAGAVTANPLLGGLDASGLPGGPNGNADPNTMRIIPSPQTNALLVYSTQREQDTVEAMLHKIDILPLQVRIDATIAEVTLNDELRYGTQFFFKSGGINGALNNLPAAAGSFNNITSIPLGTSFPGFVIGATGAGGAPYAISALQSITNVKVLSSPQIMVLDNQPARLQVGNLVPFLTTSSQSTLTANAPVINQVNYQPTGVIMQVTPRVNSGGLVTLDVSQEVSDVDPAPNTSGINSPTFLERSVNSRVVVQDGQTIGLAGLIRDSVSRGNSGIPWLKDIPVLGLLAGTQDNARTRTELLVLITPHVVHDQRDAHALTEDLRTQLPNAALVPTDLNNLGLSGSPDPNRRVRRGLRLDH